MRTTARSAFVTRRFAALVAPASDAVSELSLGVVDRMSPQPSTDPRALSASSEDRASGSATLRLRP